MSGNTVFGYVALQFGTRPENLATEGLAFVLRNSPSASGAFSSFLHAAGIDCPPNLRFETQQVGVDQCIPDLKCLDVEGRVRVVVENKFWAGLTDNQPVTYIRELTQGCSGAVLFVVPQARLRIIWDELVSRCAVAGVPLGEPRTEGGVSKCEVEGQHFLAITSWRMLLGALSTATASAADMRAHNDVAQLQGLCEAMDEQAFLPVRGEELTNVEMAKRIINFSDLPFDIVGEAEKLGFCNRKGLKETAQRYGPGGTYIRIGSYTPWFGFDAYAWLKLGISPLWVNFFAPPYSPTAEIREKLVRYRTALSPKCFDFEGRVSVPIFVAVGVEKDRVIEGAARQIGELAAELGALAATTSAAV
jgi:hypothetical protein